VADSADRKTKLAALKERIAPVAKSEDLLAIARELEAIGQEPAREERSPKPTGAVTWPRDMNESPEGTSPGWGKDPGEGTHG
jgi:hypothetical protein